MGFYNPHVFYPSQIGFLNHTKRRKNMKAWIMGLFLVAAISLVTLNCYGQTPLEFPKTDKQFITQVGDDHYLVVEDLDFSGAAFWAVWKLNKSNANWDLFIYGEPTPGEKSASGNYVYDSSKDILIWNINFSLFLGCNGPSTGTSAFSYELSEPSLRLTSIEVGKKKDETLELMRVSGSAGEIPGQWSMTSGPNNYLINFNADGTMSLSGNVQECHIE
jgi:hypothetical protein